MNVINQDYPVCNLEAHRFAPEPAFFVIFGATGDLAHRKIFPALFDLHQEGALPEGMVIIGFARRSLRHAEFRQQVLEDVRAHARHSSFPDSAFEAFSSRIWYLQADLEQPEGYHALAKIIAGENPGFFAADDGEPRSLSLPRNALFYLAVGPEHFGGIAENLGTAGLGTSVADSGKPDSPAGSQGWRRLVVEKPYGRDAESARALTNLLHRHFRETDIYRIDHYLGKETVQNLLYLRFANSVFEPIWNCHHISGIEISVFEQDGIGQRGGYYDTAGAARDMLQNHLTQLMCLVTMEPPATLDPESIRDEKVKVLQSIRHYSPSELVRHARRGQYIEGTGPDGTIIPAYRKESKVSPDSATETYAQLTLELDNWRFSGVPITLRTGKAFAEKFSQIVIQFKRPPSALFAAQCGEKLVSNALTIRIQPDEGVWLTFNAKLPGVPAIKASHLRFSWREVSNYLPEAYERLIADALAGDSTLFIRADESEHAWAVIDELEKAWRETDPEAPPEAGGLWRYPAFSPIPPSQG